MVRCQVISVWRPRSAITSQIVRSLVSCAGTLTADPSPEPSTQQPSRKPPDRNSR
jgi:hypothetical protein